MKGEKLYDAFQYIDDCYLDIADTPEKESITMKHYSYKRTITVALAAALCISILAVTAYAADVGGIQRIIQIWHYGDQTTAVLDVQAGEYALTDQSGVSVASGGGVAIEADGSERPLTEEEMIEHLNQPDLRYNEDGTVWVFYRNQKIEVTDKFDVDGVCYLKVQDKEDTLYLTIEKGKGMAISPNCYVQPN